ncbi:MAG: hypothetical protein H6Q68_704 [Firmicutes bacterium]|nr:hypothetical protein [Bacillota bacterium]
MIGDDDLSVYLTYLQAKKKYKIIKADVAVDGEHVDEIYEIERVSFERIRRITSYLVDTTVLLAGAMQNRQNLKIELSIIDKRRLLEWWSSFSFWQQSTFVIININK